MYKEDGAGFLAKQRLDVFMAQPASELQLQTLAAAPGGNRDCLRPRMPRHFNLASFGSYGWMAGAG